MSAITDCQTGGGSTQEAVVRYYYVFDVSLPSWNLYVEKTAALSC